jgi:hypothetical protein
LQKLSFSARSPFLLGWIWPNSSGIRERRKRKPMRTLPRRPKFNGGGVQSENEVFGKNLRYTTSKKIARETGRGISFISRFLC